MLSETVQATETVQKPAAPLWKRILFSEVLLTKSKATQIAYIGVMAALCIVANMFLEFKTFDVQFSVTVFFSILTGILIGPVFGFCAVFLGDFVGYVYNSWGYMYMPWVGLSVATMALVAGLVMNLPFRFKGSGYVKLAIICLATFFLCTVGISSTGFYLYNKAAGFSTAVVEYVEEHFGGGVSYFGYCCYRLIFKLQILNSIFNYALLFLAVPALNAAKPLKISIR